MFLKIKLKNGLMSKQKSTNRRLPPLLSVSPVGVRVTSSRSTYTSSPSSSRYHKNCHQPMRLLSPGPGAYLDVAPFRSSRPRTPRTPRVSKSPRLYGRKSASTISQKVISNYLDSHKDFLEEYIFKNVDIEQLERWILRKSRREYKENSTEANTKDNLNFSRWKFCVHADKREMLQELTNTLYACPNKPHVLFELARTIASSVNANLWTLYIYEPESQDLYALKKQVDGEISDQELQTIPIETSASLAAYVARTKEATRIKGKDLNLRFPDGVPIDRDRATYILCHPILQPDGELTGVLELYRTAMKSEFHEEDEEVVNSYLVWGGIALHYAELYGNMMRQRELSSFLLSIVKSIFQDMISMDTLIINIMTFARKLVNADRASLFLVEAKSSELFARIFDVNGEIKVTQLGVPTEKNDKSSKEIRFPIGKGIAGYVAMTGESLNIKEAYNDERFNRSIDQQTGYVTKNLLCMPIFIRGSIIGVVQMVNKMTGPFTKGDEEAFATFAVYCGLALHHAKLYDKIRRSEQKYKVALEILSYHYTCNDDEINKMKSLKLSIRPEALRDFKFCPSILSSDERVAASIFMFNDLFRHKSDVKLESDYLLRFTLTVRKNYRRVPYHNWAHGFTVANSAYAILYNCPGVFTPLEELALYVACLCHDLDHRGKTNQFLSNSEAPLAAIYTTSTLEHHHFNMTVSILQQEGHNILRNLSSSEYKQVLGNIKHCILATDLACFFPNKAKLSDLVKSGSFDWDFVEHRLLLQSIVMTACDLCASTKGWEQQIETVNVIFEEFYEQGDAERSQGKEPMAMMDRTKLEEQPFSQVGFLKGICVPCYELIYTLLPQTKPLFDGCQKNLAKWLVEVEETKNKDETVEIDAGNDIEVTDDQELEDKDDQELEDKDDQELEDKNDQELEDKDDQELEEKEIKS